MTSRNISVVVALCWMLLACTTAPTVMHYHPEKMNLEGGLVWPSAPEVARYRFTGALLGEQNFGLDEQSRPSTGQRFLRWLVGLGASLRESPRELVRPQTGMVDGAGRILVTDAGRQAVFVFDEPQGKLFIWRQADEYGEFLSPVGIAAGLNGEILVADSGLARVVRLDTQGSPIGSFGQNVLGRPTGLARDPAAGQVYVADTRDHDVKVFDDQGRLIRRIGGRGDTPGQFNAPTHLAFVQGKLYVTDTLNARVQVLTPEGEPLLSIGKRGLYLGNFTRPKGVTADQDGNVYVVESYYDHLLIFDNQGRFLLPVGGTGAAVGQFFLPAGVWADTQGRIFVADMFNGRVVIFQYLGA